MLFKIFILFIWFLFCSVVFNSEIRPVFGVQVNMQSNSQLFTIVAYIHNGRALTNKKILTKDEFVRFASGFWPSIYNPQKKNLLQENDIPCGLEKDPITNKSTPFCFPMDSLWKIRYSDYPFRNGTERGWSNELFKPSSKQAQYLYKNYGVYDIDFSFFIDSNFWKILKDVQNPDWIKKYRSI
jgi:hypothetical protein